MGPVAFDPVSIDENPTSAPAEPVAASGCPVPHGPIKACPVDHSAFAKEKVKRDVGQELTRWDHLMRRILRIKPGDGATEDSAHRIFSTSIFISATRCLLSYVVFPIFAPALGAATGIGPAIGIPVGIVALCFDVMAGRRVHASKHPYRWIVTAVYLCIMVLVSFLLVRDIYNLIIR